jgi:hypothetical protein
MAQFNLKICKSCGNEFRQYTSLDKCKCRSSKPQPKQKKAYVIPQVSKKRKVEMLQYSVLRTEFLANKKNQVCPITKQPTTDIHHKKGRVGSLLLDTRYWVALSREAHKFVEENPEWAKENGYSLNRL